MALVSNPLSFESFKFSFMFSPSHRRCIGNVIKYGIAGHRHFLFLYLFLLLFLLILLTLLLLPRFLFLFFLYLFFLLVLLLLLRFLSILFLLLLGSGPVGDDDLWYHHVPGMLRSVCLSVSLSPSPPPELPAGPPRWLQASQVASKGLQGPLSCLQGPLTRLQGPPSWLWCPHSLL